MYEKLVNQINNVFAFVLLSVFLKCFTLLNRFMGYYIIQTRSSVVHK